MRTGRKNRRKPIKTGEVTMSKKKKDNGNGKIMCSTDKYSPEKLKIVLQHLEKQRQMDKLKQETQAKIVALSEQAEKIHQEYIQERDRLNEEDNLLFIQVNECEKCIYGIPDGCHSGKGDKESFCTNTEPLTAGEERPCGCFSPRMAVAPIEVPVETHYIDKGYHD